MRSVQIVRYGVNHLKDNFVSVCFSDRWSGSDETSPPAARGAVQRSTDTRPLEWFLSPSSAILCEGEECPQHGLERLICSSPVDRAAMERKGLARGPGAT